ncbi:13649_t:CDS:2, partial [Dentiscutata heterogama]
MDDYEAECTIISKQYGVKDAQNLKEQVVLLGIISTVMPILLTKYPDLLALDSTGCHNSLNFPNTAFMVRSDKPHGRVIAIFISDKKTILVVDLMFESWLAINKWDLYLVAARKHFPNTQATILDAKKLQTAIEITSLVVAETIVSYFQKYWFYIWPDYKHNDCSIKINMLLESYFKKNMILHYRERYTKSLHSNLKKIDTSMCIDSGEIEREK